MLGRTNQITVSLFGECAIFHIRSTCHAIRAAMKVTLQTLTVHENLQEVFRDLWWFYRNAL